MMESSEKKAKVKLYVLSILQRKPNWLELPTDLTKNILQRLDTVDLVTTARFVCTQWWKICKDPLMWRTIHMINIDLSDPRFSFRLCSFEKICRCAIDLSCGHAEDIAIDYFGRETDDLLKYMARRARRLRRLRIVERSYFDSKKGLNEYVKEFSLLEELEISSDKKITEEFLEDIGGCCPLLKSLNLANLFDLHVNFVHQLFAIAKTMPGLRHLTCSRIKFGDDELLAILNGCPLLDSLDLQNCVCRHQLNPSLVKRCHEQIKDLQLPTFSPRDGYDDDDDGLAYVDTFEDTYANEYWEY
ncbi:hypothetical protein TSUD_123650 [Trifolium subterraneum]|uniref:F-box domain-containing protein n=1 Tax=Trifolium subterraneum TaxID=3900 RepID=A0A2Z6P7H7_TRISU|nr:hypothetical protein TSUD_123650 [Trifolium subterraneum]